MLFTASFAITAAHCVTSTAHDYSVRGATNLNSENLGVLRKVKKVNVHHLFDRETFENDIAVLELEKVSDFLQYLIL